MPLPLTFSCFSKIQIGFTFLVLAHLGSPGKGPLNGCVCVCLLVLVTVRFDSTSYVFLCADAEPLRRNISYVDLDRFSSCRRVSHVDLGPVSPVRKPAEAEAGKSRYSSPVVCIKLRVLHRSKSYKSPAGLRTDSYLLSCGTSGSESDRCGNHVGLEVKCTWTESDILVLCKTLL